MAKNQRRAISAQPIRTIRECNSTSRSDQDDFCKITLQRLLSWAKKGGFAVLDQGLFAGANFLVNILLARWLEPTQYGAFVVAYSVFILLADFHTAVLTEPMLVFGAGKYGDHFPKYLGLLIYGHWGVTSVIALLLGVVALIFWQFGSEILAQALAGLAFASPFILLLWLVRRGFYVRFQPHWSATGGVLYMVLILAGMYGFYRGNWLSPASALAMIGLVSLVVGLGLAVLLRPQLRFAGSNPTPGMVLADHWRYGRWSTATTASRWVSGNISYMLLPAWVGLKGSAGLRAVMNLIMPVLHANTAISVFLVPLFVKALKAEGKIGLYRFVRLAFILFTMSSVFYWGFLFLVRHEVLPWLYGGRYVEYADLLILAGLLSFSEGVVGVLGTAFRAMERPDLIFRCYVVSTSVALTLGLWLLAIKGVTGAVMGRLASSAATAIAMVWFHFL
ncbi:MAG: hypothetical protein HY731_01165 [Candidatus Tectomicrobia bacterium]|nr:hypothetical protein [Candidatus Tectomicrobia bacterium]